MSETPTADDEQLTLVDSRTERGTRVIGGKAYHYGRNSSGTLVLLPGPDPRRIGDRIDAFVQAARS